MKVRGVRKAGLGMLGIVSIVLYELSTAHVGAAKTRPEGRTIRIVNQSGRKIVVDWVDPSTGDLITVSSPDVDNGKTIAFDSYVDHAFMIHEPSNGTECTAGSQLSSDDASCIGSMIVVTDDEDQVALVGEDMDVVFPKESPAYGGDYEEEEGEEVEDCKEYVQEKVDEGSITSTQAFDELANCLESKASNQLFEGNNEVEFQAELRMDISDRMENHTCGDPAAETSAPIRTQTWEYLGTTRNVKILHDRPSSQIHAIEDFISPEECKAIQDAAEKKLHRGTVADGSGGSRLSDVRKAMQAGVRVPWDKEHQGDPIAAVMRRLYNYTNDAVGYNLQVEGQEDIMSIQYFGRGLNATESPDQYRPHCDGSCAGLPHVHGSRVATMVMYCDVPELGGGTNFQHSNVFVKPQLGAAAFFSYMNNETRHMEEGFTTHSGCPVIEGTKRIAVHWMRIGVDKVNTWSSFNTLTIKRGESD
mmetsp:Transcript_2137/g.5933  ORF Transcript_2137/g.5933 Transcript_2137/m.5933 type:complete len:474 (-) Transcript_2137:1490-2911(-)|eukprot:CAMPEP_0198123966 /NCGR_PEP_ID=MMETSP1442-20131203/38801_1 /TAXON_ID= /ORGANISM="Craspedostauros australis, Strain CCMP3328" /LENGTH=473 /DNA_ID=CAMNT_0043783273 /DNA_START=147 /DNA_END=1568 /DNA_ORIENTATION=+